MGIVTLEFLSEPLLMVWKLRVQLPTKFSRGVKPAGVYGVNV